jgi:carboxyl-terminal processing protease
MGCGNCLFEVFMKKKLLTLLSYIMVATIAVTMALSVDSVLDSVKIPGNTKLEQLENLILDKFIGDADKTAMEDAAAIAMIEALGDRWSYYISAKDYAAYMEQMNNSYVGIGVTIQQLPEGGFEITVVNPGGPAEAAGLKLGDVIVGVEGQSVLEMDAAECRDLVRGKEGTFVNLTVKRAGEEIDLAVERKTVQTAVATGEMLPGNVGLVHIVNFDARCYDETVAAIESLISEGATALIFDVRYNPGGFKSELVKILDYLLPEGPLFHSENYLGETAVDKSEVLHSTRCKSLYSSAPQIDITIYGVLHKNHLLGVAYCLGNLLHRKWICCRASTNP